ncbi:hypothetical protein [Phormidium sp. CCY1219]|uniref:hypothetical protein n=1 Tax=Phormidium sp. CCY1219 TaxID=2886104 RepID=UPI002D1F4C24|nr:hypothetical protein [Phormidium sp. CCY1219]MEB3826878.1 hypothetical protein [Phormidium sp. CCY1219]
MKAVRAVGKKGAGEKAIRTRLTFFFTQLNSIQAYGFSRSRPIDTPRRLIPLPVLEARKKAFGGGRIIVERLFPICATIFYDLNH